MAPTEDFRVKFAKMDPAALINAAEYADLIGCDGGRVGIYQLLKSAPDAIAEPAIRRPRLLRWRVGDVRNHLAGLRIHQQRAVRTGGRPRKVVTATPVGESQQHQ